MDHSNSRISSLEARLFKAEQEIRRLKSNAAPVGPAPLVSPTAPWQPPFPQNPATFQSKCSQCGITLDRVMGYCCLQPTCPTGLGGVYCKVAP